MANAGRSGILHGVVFAPYVRKVRIVLAAKGIEHRHVSVMPGAMDAEFLALSPLRKVPVWEEPPDFVLPDSSAICAYLERRCPSPPVYPADPRAFASSLFWEEYADTRLVDACEPIFYERVVRPHVLRQAGNEELVQRQLEEVVPPVFDQLESLYLTPGRLRAADSPASAAGAAAGRAAAAIEISAIAIWSPIVNLEHVGIGVDPARWPRLAGFMEAMNAHPLVSPIIARERSALGVRAADEPDAS